MNIAYIDDELNQRIINVPVFMNVFTRLGIRVRRFDFFESPGEFLDEYESDSYDLIILDIIMDQIDGIELARRIRAVNSEVRIVFCSSSNEFANESYDVNACYYIQKPVLDEDVEKMIGRINVADYELRRFIVMPDGQKVLLRNIVATEYLNHTITMYMKKGPVIRSRISQKDLESLLRPYGYFLEINTGTIINLHEVEKLQDSDFLMSDGKTYQISRRRKKEVDDAYDTFLLNVIRKEL